MFCGLGEEESTRFRKKKEAQKNGKRKKKTKRRKTLIASEGGLVGIKGYLKTVDGQVNAKR